MKTIMELLAKYIQKTEIVFTEIRIPHKGVSIGEAAINNIVEEARRYLEDAKYYQGKKRFETALAAVAYCEGLLDALRLLGLVEFTWP